jgi:hypothetical protein
MIQDVLIAEHLVLQLPDAPAGDDTILKCHILVNAVINMLIEGVCKHSKTTFNECVAGTSVPKLEALYEVKIQI